MNERDHASSDDPDLGDLERTLTDSDFPEPLQHTLREMLEDEASGDGACLPEPDFREALQRVARPRRSD